MGGLPSASSDRPRWLRAGLRLCSSWQMGQHCPISDHSLPFSVGSVPRVRAWVVGHTGGHQLPDSGFTGFFLGVSKLFLPTNEKLQS